MHAPPLKTLALRTRLRVHLYSILWNEAPMLEFFFRHYDPWISRYVLFDDGSTDGTLDYLSRHPRVEVRRFERQTDPRFMQASRAVHNSVWKESRGQADWVVITAIDEHLHRRDLVPWLEAQHAAGTTLIPALGYQMVSEVFPSPGVKLSDSVTMGAPYLPMNKLSLFRPDALRETGYAGGRHTAAPTGELVLPQRDELLLLHYKYLGRDYVRTRAAELAGRAGDVDRYATWATNYRQKARAEDRSFDRFLRSAVDTADPDLCPWQTHGMARWWRLRQFDPQVR